MSVAFPALDVAFTFDGAAGGVWSDEDAAIITGA